MRLVAVTTHGQLLPFGARTFVISALIIRQHHKLDPHGRLRSNRRWPKCDKSILVICLPHPLGVGRIYIIQRGKSSLLWLRFASNDRYTMARSVSIRSCTAD